MIIEFVEKWNKYNKDLEDYFRNNEQSNYANYKDIVKLLFDKVINKDFEFDCDKFDTKNILVVDDGEYQGTQIFILHRNSYQPSIEEYVYTNTYYGSCSGCDTLQSIVSYDYDEKPNEKPNEKQIKDYMKLSLHLLQKIKYMSDEG